MQIPDIKSRLTITQVLNHYNLKADRNNRLLCPFHDDKTPSLQVYPNTNTWTCFRTNCQAGSGDVIDFIMHYEKCSKHEALFASEHFPPPDPSSLGFRVPENYCLYTD